MCFCEKNSISVDFRGLLRTTGMKICLKNMVRWEREAFSRREIKWWLFSPSLLLDFIVFVILHQAFINAKFLISKVHSCDPKVLLPNCFSERKGKVGHQTKAEFLFLCNPNSQLQSLPFLCLWLEMLLTSTHSKISVFHLD